MVEMEEAKLSTSLQRLELEGPKRPAKSPDVNPFRRRSKSLSSIGSVSCDCVRDSNGVKKTTSFKRGGKKLVRDPVLKIIKFKAAHRKVKQANDKLFGQCAKHGEKDFKTLINACEQLSLERNFTAGSFQIARSDNTNVSRSDMTVVNLVTCSHQARLNANPPCDVTIDELASYFETSVHIPKKMSSMAEMMYI